VNFEIQAGDVIQIITTIIVAYEIYRVARETKIQREQSSKLETLNVLATYHEDVRSFIEWNRLVENKERLETPESLVPEDRNIITRYLTVCERLSVGVRQGVYSFEIVKSAISKSLRINYVKLTPYIQSRRELVKSDKVYEQFEWLCFELEKNSLESRLPSDWKISAAAKDGF